jgi:hypothetical protein
MAIDSAAKRFSIMDMDGPTTPGLPIPSGTVGAAARQTFLWLYSGLVSAAAATAVAALMMSF